MSKDLSISCSSSYYQFGRAWAAIMVLVYPVGLPLLYFYLLFKNKEVIKAREEINAIMKSAFVTARRQRKKLKTSGFNRITENISFIYAAYLPTAWYWEIVEVYKRLFLMAIFPSIFYGYAAQYPITVLFCVGFTKLYDIFKPFESRSDNVLADVGQYQVLFVYYVGSIIYFESFDSNAMLYSALDYSLITINLTILVLTFYFAYNDYIKLSKTSPQTSGVIHKRIQLQSFDLSKNHFHLIEINEMLCSQPDEGIELMLSLIYERLYSRGSGNMTNRCFYYYPMTPLPLTFYAQGYNTVEYYCPKYSVYFYRVDTCDIDRFKFISSYSFEGKLSRIVIPEEAFGRHVYRHRHVAAVTRREEILAQAVANDKARHMLMTESPYQSSNFSADDQIRLADDQIRLADDASQFPEESVLCFTEFDSEYESDISTVDPGAETVNKIIDAYDEQDCDEIKTNTNQAVDLNLNLLSSIISQRSSSHSSLYCDVDDDEVRHQPIAIQTADRASIPKLNINELQSQIPSLAQNKNLNSLKVLKMTTRRLQSTCSTLSAADKLNVETRSTLLNGVSHSRTTKVMRSSNTRRSGDGSPMSSDSFHTKERLLAGIQFSLKTSESVRIITAATSNTKAAHAAQDEFPSLKYDDCDDSDISIDANIDEEALRREGADQLRKLKMVQDEIFKEYKAHRRPAK
jgi:hypothetical protein